MGTEHEAVRRALGRVGVWTFGFDERAAAAIAGDVRAIEEAGYPALWIPEGGGSNDVLTNLSWLLGASERLTIASGIANISAREPEVLARGAAFLRETSGNRLVLGVGVGHSYTTVRRGIEWDQPLARMRAYLDVMDEAAEERPAAPRMLAALGDGMLRLAAERALGAHSYFVPVAHTARAREVLGTRAGAGRRAGRAADRRIPRPRGRRRASGPRTIWSCRTTRTTGGGSASARTTSPAAARTGCWTRRSPGDPTRSSIGCARTWRPAPTTSASRSIGSADPDEDVAVLARARPRAAQRLILATIFGSRSSRSASRAIQRAVRSSSVEQRLGLSDRRRVQCEIPLPDLAERPVDRLLDFVALVGGRGSDQREQISERGVGPVAGRRRGGRSSRRRTAW